VPGRVKLAGRPLRGRVFDFGTHDTFLFGRAADCRACLAPDDTWPRATTSSWSEAAGRGTAPGGVRGRPGVAAGSIEPRAAPRSLGPAGAVSPI